MNKVKKFFQKHGQAVLWIKESFQKCRQAVLCVPVFFPKYGQAILWIKKLSPKCKKAVLWIKEFFQKYGQVALWSILVVLLASFISVMFSDGAESSFANLLGTESKNATLAYIGGSIAFIGTLIAKNRPTNTQIKNNELIEAGHIDERFKAAVEHLSNDQTRIAAYYEFYSLADRHKELRENIFNILCGQLRKITRPKEYIDKYPKVPSENMQTLLDVLFKSKDKNVFDQSSANLERTYLAGANFDNANMRFANFQGATLQDAIFLDVNLQNARFSEANLSGANLLGAKNLTSEMIEKAIIDEKTVLPEGVTHTSRKETP